MYCRFMRLQGQPHTHWTRPSGLRRGQAHRTGVRKRRNLDWLQHWRHQFPSEAGSWFISPARLVALYELLISSTSDEAS